ncbi:GNAT family N-acetyltransferase [Sphingobacterium sp. SGL-16]|uniref:GNAT family N-acetyltransferase n=1 Tax=Sphingobacterium sp. SGL-16 TaxID=2710883 RepID=UPI0013E9F6AA|nr:GNAT family N-acetyltransferase [Sphingobacterium sp. SGL-16]NGM73238.1 GNAT family N-acetyltransferase [Sphingobacterium sp. SGL-16]
MLQIEKATTEDASIIHKLAHQIYYPTYLGILSQEQMDFMLEKSYTVSALQESMRTHQDFYIAYDQQAPIGFIALKSKNATILRIEKLYLLPQTQGKGFGSQLIDFAKNKATIRNKSIVELNVNRGNNAYYFYLKVGFKVVQEVDIPYFGYILDDYVMQVQL